MDLKLDETTVVSLLKMYAEKVSALEDMLAEARIQADTGWREANEANDRRRILEDQIDDLYEERNSLREAGYNTLDTRQTDMLRTENAKLQSTIRDLGNKLLACSEDAKAIKFRYINGDLKGRKIQAIKEVRDKTHCGLKEAKDYIEAV